MNKKWIVSSLIAIAGVFLLAAMFFPGGVTAQDPAPDTSPAGETLVSLGTAFTYQGELSDNGSPANGTYDFQFLLYDSLVGGSQVGSIVTVDDLTVADGLFTAALDFGAIFDGTALWLEIGVRDGASAGAYTILSPRQPLTGAPYALGLIPGAVISGNIPEAGLAVQNDGGSGLQVVSAAGSGLTINNASLDAVHIDNAGLDGVDVNIAGNDGVQVDSAGGDGLQVDTVGQDGVRVVDAGRYGVNVVSATNAGIRVDNAGGPGVNINNAGLNGVRVGTASEDGVRVVDAGRDGVFVGDAVESGLNIDHADGDGIFICATGTESTCTPSDFNNNGLEIGNAEDSGVYVDSAGEYGVLVDSAGISGVIVNSSGSTAVFVVTAGLDGMRVTNAMDDGVDVFGANLAGFFEGNIQVTGNCTGCILATFGVNTSGETLQPGDLVTVQGSRIISNDSVPMLIEVSPASAGQTVVGVVQGWAEIKVEKEPRPTEIGLRLIPRDGPAMPGEYVTIIYSGPVQVRASALAEGITPGVRLTVADESNVRPLQTTEVNGIQVAESAPTIGIALSEPDADGLVWVLVNPQ